MFKHGNDRRPTRILKVIWFMEPTNLLPLKATKLLQAFRQTFPNCLPQRFGADESFQHRFSDDCEQKFLDEVQRSRFGIFNWTALSPCLGGGIYLPTKNNLVLSNERQCVSVELDFECTEKGQDELEQKIPPLFASVCLELECFYAGALLYRSEEGCPNFGRKTTWAGIPDVKTWLTWFGEDIRAKVSQYLNPRYMGFDGKLMKVGDRIPNAEELDVEFPKLPDSLVNQDSGTWSQKPFFNRK